MYHELVIERPRGCTKRYHRNGREVVETYPTAHGSIQGMINPEDGENVDVFVGSGGPCCGWLRFDALHNDGTWRHDEHTWFVNCTALEVYALANFTADRRTARDLNTLKSDRSLNAQIVRVARDAMLRVKARRAHASAH